MPVWKRLNITLLFCIAFSLIFNWGKAQGDSTSKTRQIIIKNADLLFGETINGEKVQRLVGKVVFQHEGSTMYCDSAVFNTTQNSLKASGKIHIEQGDTLDLYGDNLDYDGNTKVAHVIGRVRLISPTVNLNTSKLTYDRVAGQAWYADSGVTVSNKDKIKSKKGYYNVNTSEFAFKENVVIENPEYTLYSDTLIYNTKTDITYFKGPSEIFSEDSYIYCENGWYDKKNDKAQFNQNAYVTAENHIMKGDSLYYERKQGYGKAIGNISIEDTVENIIVTGNFAESFRDIEKYIVTDSAQLIQIFDADTLFMHADTLYAIEDSLGKRITRAYYGVRFYKSDMQGVCDSLVYTQADSLMHLFTDPILWSEENQITADDIRITMGKGKIYDMKMRMHSMIVSEVDTIRFNQIAGIDMDGFFKENKLNRIHVYEDGKTIYYPKDDESGDLIGMNKVDCRNLIIYIEEEEVARIVFLEQPVGTLFPLEQADPFEYRLTGFRWWDKIRPKDQPDIFREIKPGDLVEEKQPEPVKRGPTE